MYDHIRSWRGCHQGITEVYEHGHDKLRKTRIGHRFRSRLLRSRQTEDAKVRLKLCRSM